ncbi:MAG: recombinase family protein [Clostridiales bacterium]|nr:recombinase family protein [Clostridiales bacterium]
MSEVRVGNSTSNRVRTVTVIPPRVRTLSSMPTLSVHPKRVAAYARVSTNSEEQLTSYEAQVKHYSEYIKSRALIDHWQFVDVYTDKGITGTSTTKREGFNRMMQDALAGKIDLIITKSVSRFARNTVDTLTAIRRLKEHGVEVYFEEQNIYTLDGKGELLLTIMSSIAQEESRNISENVTWGIRKRFADGKVSIPYKRFMGYRRGEDGAPEIVETEAKIVRGIFRRYLAGATSTMIAKELNEADVPCPARKSQLGEDEIEAEKADMKKARWSASTVESILTNEKYKGDAILQKTYCTDYIQKTFVENDGSEIPKYYAQNSHPAIISSEIFDLTQMEMEWRKSLNGSYSGKSCFASRVVCGDCGAFYGSKVWHSTDAYRRVIWRCNGKYIGEKKCSTPYVTQEELEKAFVNVLQRVIREKDAITAACREKLVDLDPSELDAEVARLENEVSSIAERLRKMVEENARVRRDQAEYQREYDRMVVEYDRVNSQIQAMENQNRNRERAKRKLEIFLGYLEKAEVCEAFEPYTFATLVEKVVVGCDGRLEFYFRSGMIVEYLLKG